MFVRPSQKGKCGSSIHPHAISRYSCDLGARCNPVMGHVRGNWRLFELLVVRIVTTWFIGWRCSIHAVEDISDNWYSL